MPECKRCGGYVSHGPVICGDCMEGKRMKQGQIDFGRDQLKEIADAWGVSVDKAARILEGKEYRQFWNWLNADEFLCAELYKPNSESGRSRPPNGGGMSQLGYTGQ